MPNMIHEKRYIFSILLFFHAPVIAAELAEQLNIPKHGAPWKMDAQIEQYRVNLIFPDQIEKLKDYPESIAQNVNRRIAFRSTNIDIMTRYAQSIQNLIESKTFQQQPEYNRNLKEVVISLHPTDSLAEDPLYRHWPVIEKLPKYTWIHLITPVEALKKVSLILKASSYKDRITIHKVKTWKRVEDGVELVHATTRWAQDLFETTRDEHGTEYIIVPASRWQINDLNRPDNQYVKFLANKNRKVIYAPIFFRGGNILIGQSGRNILFVGERELLNNSRDYYNALFGQPNKKAILFMLKRLTGADDIVVLPNSNHLFHLDMAVSFVGNGKVILINPLDREKVSQEDINVIDTIKNKLDQYGFDVTLVPTTSERMNTYQSPVNIVPYTNLETNQIEALVPQYPDSRVLMNVSLNTLVNDAIKKAGVNPVKVYDYFHKLSGNTHCALSVIR